MLEIPISENHPARIFSPSLAPTSWTLGTPGRAHLAKFLPPLGHFLLSYPSLYHH